MESLSGDTYYKLLGLESNCSEKEVSRAYKKLALEYHPDRNPDNKQIAEENFKKICEAYEVLSDKMKRQAYDANARDVHVSGFSWEQAEDVFERACNADAILAELWRRRTSELSNGPQSARPGQAPIDNNGVGRETPSGMGPNGGMGGSLTGGTGHPMSGGRTGFGVQPGIIPSWTSVTVRGLKGAAHHNGKVAQIESYDAESGRYALRLANGEGVKIKYENVLQRLEVECYGMTVELNGLIATLTSHDESTDRYYCDVRGHGKQPLLRTNMILPAGARGKVAGLTSAAGSKWNDQIGNVVSFDRDAGRYVVQMTREDQLRIKPVNFRI
jgi:DnaJ-domain-containing protein 1